MLTSAYPAATYSAPKLGLFLQPKKYVVLMLTLLALLAVFFIQFSSYLVTPNSILKALETAGLADQTPYVVPNPYDHKLDMSSLVNRFISNKSASELEKTENVVISLVDKDYETNVKKTNITDTQQEVKNVIDRYLSKHPEFQNVSPSRFSPTFSATVAFKDFAKLSSDSDIAFFDKNSEVKKTDIVFPYKSLGAESVWTATKMVNGQSVFAGANGTGQSVVLIDDGVDPLAPLSPSLLWGACFSKTATDVASVCNSGNVQDLSTLSNHNTAFGSTCPTIMSNKVLCTHGTFLASLIAGKTATSDQIINNPDGSFIANDGRTSGMATGANIFSIKIGHALTSNAACGYDPVTKKNPAPCLRIDSQELLDAINYVKTIKLDFEAQTNTSMAAVNISLGFAATDNEGLWPSFCDSNLPNGANNPRSVTYKAAIDELTKVNVPTFIGTGNNNQFDKITFPACISSGISVGALNQTLDKVANFSNMNRTVDLLAPGENVIGVQAVNRNPSGPVTYEFSPDNGTSQATAVSSGTYALLKSGMPPDTQYTQIQHVMKYGVSYLGDGANFYVKDIRNGMPANYNNTTPALKNGDVFSSMYVNMKLLPVGGRGMEFLPAFITNAQGKTAINTNPMNYAIYYPSSNNAGTFSATRTGFAYPTSTHAAPPNTFELITKFIIEDQDMNGDYLPDIVISKKETYGGSAQAYVDHQPSIYYFSKDGIKTGQTLYAGTANPLNGPGRNVSFFNYVKAADINSDGNKDLVFFGTYDNRRQVQVWYLDQYKNVINVTTDVMQLELDALFPANTPQSKNAAAKIHYIGDVNGDGVTDFVLHTEKESSTPPYQGINDNLVVYLMKKNNTSTSTVFPLSVDKNPDGTDKIITIPYDAPSTYLCAPGVKSVIGYNSLTGGCVSPGFYDLNGDGILDIAYIGAKFVNAKKQYFLRYQLMDSSFTPGPLVTLPLTSNGNSIFGEFENIDILADMNFDGVPDLVTYEQVGAGRIRRIRSLKFDTLTKKMQITGEVRINNSPIDISTFYSTYVPYYR